MPRESGRGMPRIRPDQTLKHRFLYEKIPDGVGTGEGKEKRQAHRKSTFQKLGQITEVKYNWHHHFGATYVTVEKQEAAPPASCRRQTIRIKDLLQDQYYVSTLGEADP